MPQRRRPLEDPTLAEQYDQLRNDYDAAHMSRFRRMRTGLLPLGSGRGLAHPD